jgi:transcriptional regulator with XRE-family HTH domain
MIDTKMNVQGALKKRLREIVAGDNPNMKHFTRKELAEKVGAGRTSIGNYVDGKQIPPADILGKIAQAAGVSVDWLLGLVPDPTTEPEMKNICTTTGLTEGQINTIIKFTKHNEITRDFIKLLIPESGHSNFITSQGFHEHKTKDLYALYLAAQEYIFSITRKGSPTTSKFVLPFLSDDEEEFLTEISRNSLLGVGVEFIAHFADELKNKYLSTENVSDI